MTPAVGWTEAAYYAASRQARNAWQRTSHQLTLDDGLNEGGVTRAANTPVGGVLTGCGAPLVEPPAGGLDETRAAEVAAANAPAAGALLVPPGSGPCLIEPAHGRSL